MNSENISVEEAFARLFVAPAYVPYVFHVLEDAKRRGIKVLYFVSRDAYVLQRIAEQIPHDYIEYKYLFISRKSLEGAFFHIASDETIDSIGLKGAKDFSTDYSKEYELAIDYLRQEGVFEDDIALVDVGWYGRTRVMINWLRKEIGKDFILSYYFGYHSTVLSEEFGLYDSYLKEPVRADWSTYVIEEFYSACPYGSTMGYKRINSKVESVFRKGEEYNETPLVKANVEACINYTKWVQQNNIGKEELYKKCVESMKLLFDTDFVFSDYTYIDFFNSLEPTIKRLSIREIIEYIRYRELSYRINVPASLRLTLGKVGRAIVYVLRVLYRAIRKIVNVIRLKK